MSKNSRESREYIKNLVEEALRISHVNHTQGDTQSLETISKRPSLLSNTGRTTTPLPENSASGNLTKENLSQAAQVTGDGENGDTQIEPAVFNAIVHFIDKYFYFDSAQQKFFHSSGFGAAIEQDVICELVKLLNHLHYDGFGLYDRTLRSFQKNVLVSSDNDLRSFKTPNGIFQRYIQVFLPTFSTLKRNLYPQVLAFQFINVLEVTAVLTALWEYNPNYKPDWKIYTVMGILALAVMRNNYYFAGAMAGLSQERIKTLRDEICDNTRRFLTDYLREIFFRQRELDATGTTVPLSSAREKLINALLQQITQPRLIERILQEWSSWSGAVVKFSATMAVCLALGFSRPIAISLGMLGGLVQGIDVGYTQNNAIAMMSRGWRDYLNGRIPPLRNDNNPINTTEYAIFFHKVADFEILVRGFMSKIAPIAWAIILFDAIRRVFALTNLPAQYGVYGIGFISACLYATVFSLFNIDQRLAIELPTQRQLAGYRKIEYINYDDDSAGAHPLTLWMRFCQLSAGAAPLAGIAGMIAYQFFKLDLIKSGYMVALPTEILTILLLMECERFAEIYSQIFEFRFMEPALRNLDTLMTEWKTTGIILSAVIFAYGFYRGNQFIEAPAEIILFLSATALLAECIRASINGLRYIIAPTLLNMVALLTWFNHCLLPLLHTYELYDKHAPASHSQAFSQDQAKLYHTICVIALLIGLGGAYASWHATGRHVSALTKTVDNIRSENILFNQEEIAGSRFLGAVGSCFGSFFRKITHCCRQDAQDTVETDGLVSTQI